MTEWDAAKNRTNIAKHGVSFVDFERFDWDFAVCFDIQHHGGEEREVWLAPIGNRLHVAVITMREAAIRLVSLRLATSHEVRKWQKEIENG